MRLSCGVLKMLPPCCPTTWYFLQRSFGVDIAKNRKLEQRHGRCRSNNQRRSPQEFESVETDIKLPTTGRPPTLEPADPRDGKLQAE